MTEKPQPADIIFYPVSGKSPWSSRIVAIGQLILGKDRSLVQYSHVTLYEDNGYQLESVFPRAKRSRVDASRPYEIWRVHDLTEYERRDIVKWAYRHLGQWYDMVYILSFGHVTFKQLVHALSFHLIKIDGTGEEVCCKFVRDAYRSIAISLPGERPDEMMASKKIYKVATYTPERRHHAR